MGIDWLLRREYQDADGEPQDFFYSIGGGGDGEGGHVGEAEYRLHAGRRFGVGGFGVLQQTVGRADAEHGPPGGARGEVYGYAFAVGGVYADAVWDFDGAVLLADELEERRAVGIFAEFDRAGADDGARDAEAGGVCDGGGGQVAFGVGRGGEDGLCEGVEAGSGGSRV